jgi:RimJ/RimL family protein N-acetyltransferase
LRREAPDEARGQGGHLQARGGAGGLDSVCGMTVELCEIALDDPDVRATLLEHTLPPEQQDFAAPAVESLPRGDGDPDWVSVAIMVEGVPVGMFALDRGGYFREFDHDPSDVLFRAFYIAPEHQGNGYAIAAVCATKAFVRQRLPDVKRVVLTVNVRNPVAIATYLRGGFAKTGEYLGGLKGPQHVMVLEI